MNEQNLQKNELSTALNWHENGLKVAICTVIETWGSSPRPVGSQLVVDENGQFQGSVSGGCLEGAVVHAALNVINEGNSRVLEFGVSDESAWDVGLACGGRIKIYVEPLSDGPQQVNQGVKS